MTEKKNFDLTGTKSIEKNIKPKVDEPWKDDPFKWSFTTKHMVDIGDDPRNIGIEVVFKVKDKSRLNEMQNLMRRTIEEMQEESAKISGAAQAMVESLLKAVTQGGKTITIKEFKAMLDDDDDDKKDGKSLSAYAFLKVRGKDDAIDKLLAKHLPHIAKCEGNFNLTIDVWEKFDPRDHTDFIVGFCDYFLDQHRVMKTVY